MEKHLFKQHLAKSLTTPEMKSSQIRLAVLKHCENAGFISSKDQEENSQRYQWLQEVIKLNLWTLNLLDQIVLDVNHSLFPLEVKTELDAKAASVIKDIAKRLMAANVQFSTVDIASDPFGVKLDINMKAD